MSKEIWPQIPGIPEIRSSSNSGTDATKRKEARDFPFIPESPNEPMDASSVAWMTWFSILSQELQEYFGSNGLVPAHRTSSVIAQIEANPSTIGRFIYNCDTGTMMVNNTGTFKNILTS